MDRSSTFRDVVILPTYLFGNKPLDPVLDTIDTALVIGENRVQRPLRLEHSMMLSDMSNTPDADIRKCLVHAASMSGLPYNLGSEGMHKGDQGLVDEAGAMFIHPWTSDRIGASARTLNKAIAVEILISGTIQSSIKQAQDSSLSRPGMHMDMESPKDLKKHVDLLKEITDYSIPVIVKMGAGNVYGDVKLAAKAGADAIIIDLNLSAGSTMDVRHVQGIGMPGLAVIAPALKAMKETNAKEENIKVLMSGGFYCASDVFKCLAMGMDGVCLDRDFVASEFGIDPKDAMYGQVSPDDIKLPEKSSWKLAGEGLAKGLAEIGTGVRYLFAITATANKKSLSPECLRATTYDAASLTGLKLAGYEKALPIWMH